MFFELLLKHQSIGFDQVNFKYTVKWHCSSHGKISWDYLLYVLCRFKKFLETVHLYHNTCAIVASFWLSFMGGGAGECPPEAVSHPSDTFVPPKIWFENNIKISITKEIYITIDFAPEKILGRQPALGSQII